MRRYFRVLIVEDEHSVGSLIERILSPQEGFQCEWVSTLRAAKARCRVNSESQIDLIVLDLKLEPGVTGLAALTALTTEFPRIPICVCTGEGNEAEKIEALRRGAQAYIYKPILDIKQFQDGISTAIARQENVNRLRDELSKAKKGFNWKAVILGGGGALIVEVVKAVLEVIF